MTTTAESVSVPAGHAAENALSSPALSSFEDDIAEWRRLLGLVDAERFPRIGKEIDDKIQKLGKVIKALQMDQPVLLSTTHPAAKADEAADPSSGATAAVNSTQPTSPTKEFTPLHNFAWDQTSERVSMYITIEGVHLVPTEAIQVDFSSESLDLKVIDLNKKNYRLFIRKLGHPVKPSKCKMRVKTNSVNITLEKEKWNWWDSIQFKEAILPRRPKEKKEESADPGASVMNLMKDLYESGDDEMKRTIQKAWVEADDKRRGAPDLGSSMLDG